ncbi:MAG: N-acetylmuramoyl-L-alanine amidase [Calothrix sp. MO_167.B12]|nr:N-acetylmuramoyl-L-alanine amidase [Calothrix sp. MO_167.B12]
MTKYAIDLGHGCPFDRGAVGIRREEDLINEVGKLIIQHLKQLGHEVVPVRPASARSLNQSLRQRCQRANSSNCNIFVSLHANAFDRTAYGTEVYAISLAGQKIAGRVCKEISNLGFFNRGVKNRPAFYVLRGTTMPAILVEMCFCDSAKDMALFDAKKMALAIVKGLTGEVPCYDQPSLLIA